MVEGDGARCVVLCGEVMEPVFSHVCRSEPTIAESDETPKLAKFRWVIPPGGDRTLRLLFTSDVVGTVDQVCMCVCVCCSVCVPACTDGVCVCAAITTLSVV